MTPSNQTFTLSTFSCLTDVSPVAKTMTWAQLLALLEKRHVRPNKQGTLFSPARYAPGKTRHNENVLDNSLYVLDFDAGIAPGPLTKLWQEKGLAYALYSSHSHKPDYPKWRAVFPLTEPVPGEQWPEVWKALTADLAGKHAAFLDTGCKDVSRAYYLPSCPLDTKTDAFSVSHPGACLNWRDVVSAAAAHAPAPEAKGTGKPSGSRGGTYGKGLPITHEELIRFGDIISTYNERADHHDILTAHGWQFAGLHSGEEHWRRPGKSEGNSGTFGYAGSRHFVCYTSSAPPLVEHASYSKFDLECVLSYGGSVEQAARGLAAQNYGELPVEETKPEQGTQENPDAEDVGPDPLLSYIRMSDSKLAGLRRNSLSRQNKHVIKEAAAAKEHLPSDCVDTAVVEIYVGRTLRRREDAKKRDTCKLQGEWYDTLPTKHGARPYIVSRVFGLPIPEGNARIHPALYQKMAELQGYARIWRAFGQKSDGVDAPPRLFTELVSLKDPARRDYYLQEWTEGRGRAIYSRIRDEKRLAAEEKAQPENTPPYKDTHDSGAQDFDAETGEVQETEQTIVHESQVNRLMSPLMSAQLDALEAQAAELGKTPEVYLTELMCRTAEEVADDAQKHNTCYVFGAENRAENTDFEIEEAPSNSENVISQDDVSAQEKTTQPATVEPAPEAEDEWAAPPPTPVQAMVTIVTPTIQATMTKIKKRIQGSTGPILEATLRAELLDGNVVTGQDIEAAIELLLVQNLILPTQCEGQRAYKKCAAQAAPAVTGKAALCPGCEKHRPVAGFRFCIHCATLLDAENFQMYFEAHQAHKHNAVSPA